MTNHSAQPGLMEALTTMRAHDGQRALLVTLDAAGQPKWQPVMRGESVVDVHGAALFDHLSASPVSTDFLVQLRDYAIGRLAAREEAQRAKGFTIPAPSGWIVSHAAAFQPVRVR